MNDLKNKSQRYVGQIYSAIKYYERLLDYPIIIVGDFNWNIIWDNESNLSGKLIDVINLLKQKQIVSAYHISTKEDFGKETSPTLFMYHKLEKPYNIYYCFISKEFKIQNLKIGNYNDWITKSDHMPLIIDLK
jgi:endonuclease/exonuclease/phosphatase family metal-dependent hydrolase